MGMTESNKFEDYEETPVSMECKCGGQQAIMEVRYSDDPAFPGFNRTIDRRFTCQSCKHATIFQGTYPIAMNSTPP